MSVQSVLFVHLAFLYGPSPHAPGSLCGAGSPCTHPQALRESMAKPCSAPRVTFSPMRKSPKTHQGPPGPWTPGEGGGSKSVPL